MSDWKVLGITAAVVTGLTVLIGAVTTRHLRVRNSGVHAAWTPFSRR